MKWYIYYVEDNNKPKIVKEFDSREEAKAFLNDFRAFCDRRFDMEDSLVCTYHIGNDFDLDGLA